MIMNKWLRLMRFDRPIGILLLLWPTTWALLVAGAGFPSIKNVIIFLTGVVLMRAAGCVINDYADREFDQHVARTKTRPIAAGEIQPRQALIVFFALLLLAFILVLQTNTLTIQLSVVGVVLAASYPFFKRFTHLPQIVLGVAFAWSIPMAFAAELNHIPVEAWWLFAINIVWTIIYDTEYAMADRQDDLKIGVKSTAILFGNHDRLVIGLLQLTMLLMMAVYIAGFTDWPAAWPLYLAGLITIGLFAQQQLLIRHRQAANCFRAFLQNNWVGITIATGLMLYFRLPHLTFLATY